jgi:hypothetical protein
LKEEAYDFRHDVKRYGGTLKKKYDGLLRKSMKEC